MKVIVCIVIESSCWSECSDDGEGVAIVSEAGEGSDGSRTIKVDSIDGPDAENETLTGNDSK